MANQSPDRREMLQMLAKAAIASQFPGFERWVFAGQHEHTARSATPRAQGPYRPQYFTPDEYRTLDILAALIIPTDETPGAREAGVSEFIDFMAAHGEEEVRKPMRSGLAWLDERARSGHGHPFAELTPQQQTDVLKPLAYRAQSQPADVEGQVFFRLVRRYTVMGYYTSRVGLQELDYPGLKMYSQSPACPHTDDPEHLHLPPPRV